MSQVEVLCGPPGSGKTRQIIARYAAWLRPAPDDPRRGDRAALLVPSAQHRQMVSLALLDSGLPGLFDPRLFTFTSLAEAVLEANHEPARRLSATQRDLLLRDVVTRLYPDGQARGLGPVVSFAGFVTGLGRLIGDLKRALVGADDWDALAGRAGLRDHPVTPVLGAVYREYQRRLQELKLHDDPGLLWALRNLLAEGKRRPLEGLELLLVDGFDEFTPAHLAVLRLLADGADHTVFTLCLDEAAPGAEFLAAPRRTLDELRAQWPDCQVRWLAGGDGPLDALRQAVTTGAPVDEAVASHVEIVGAPGPLAEVREVARLLKARVAAGEVALEDCAIVVRSLAAYETPLREVFAEYGIPLELGAGPALGQAPAVQAVLDVLAVADGDYQRDDVAQLLNSNYVDEIGLQTNGPTLDAGCFERLAREAHVIGGRRHWAEQLALLRRRLNVEREAARQGLTEDAEDRRVRPMAMVEGHLAQVERAQRLFGRLTEVLDPLANAPSRIAVVQRLGEALARLGIVARAEGWPGPADSRREGDDRLVARDRQAFLRLLELLREYGEAEQVLGALPPGAAFRDLVDYLREASGAVRLAGEPSWGGAAPALTVEEASGRHFRHVYLLGLREGEFPRHAAPDAFYGEDDRRRLNSLGRDLLDSDERRRAREALAFYRALGAATERLTVTWPTTDAAGKQRLRSPFLEELLAVLPTGSGPRLRNRSAVLPDLEDAGSPAELLAALLRPAPESATPVRHVAERLLIQATSPGEVAGVLAREAIERERDSEDAPGAFDGVLSDPAVHALLAGDDYFGPAHAFSASQFDSYALCPMRFFLERVLGLAELEDPDEDLQAADLGVIMHRVLANFFRQRLLDERLTPLAESDLEAERARLEQCLDAAWGDPEARRLMPHAKLAELQRAAVGKDLRAVLDHETSPRNRDPNWLRRWVRDCELPYRMQLAPGDLLVVGRVDRVDEVLGTGALRVYDYKTGPSPTGPDIEAGRASQLPLYLRAVCEAYPDQELDECGYYRIRGLVRCAPRGRGPEELQDLMDGALAHVRRHVAGIRAGHFPPSPTAGCPSYCAFRAICRYSRTRLESKPPPAPAPTRSNEGDEA